MAGSKKVSIAVVGAGGVGRHFLNQLSHIILPQYSHVSVVLIARSTRALIATTPGEPISLSTWESDLAASSLPAPTTKEILSMLELAKPAILVENTSSQDIANAYPDFLRQGVHIVTPNKKAFSSSLELWQNIKRAEYSTSRPHNGLLYHESSVGAGLPIISTLKDLIATGDTVRKIEGVLSGTMSFLFNAFSPITNSHPLGSIPTLTWSSVVAEAKAKGYTEPDPRDDLNGLDVARKLVILARLAGLEIESPTSFPVQSLIPDPLTSLTSAEDFLLKLPEFDAEMERMKNEAEREGKVIRFVGSVDLESRKAEVCVKKFEKGSAVAGLVGSDNLFSFFTARYGERPLIIQGAGAGGEVTAMGASSDLIKVLQRIS